MITAENQKPRSDQWHSGWSQSNLSPDRGKTDIFGTPDQLVHYSDGTWTKYLGMNNGIAYVMMFNPQYNGGIAKLRFLYRIDSTWFNNGSKPMHELSDSEGINLLEYTLQFAQEIYAATAKKPKVQKELFEQMIPHIMILKEYLERSPKHQLQQIQGVFERFQNNTGL